MVFHLLIHMDNICSSHSELAECEGLDSLSLTSVMEEVMDETSGQQKSY